MKDNNFKHTSKGTMEMARDEGMRTYVNSGEGMGFRSIESHLNAWDSMAREQILEEIAGDRSTHAHESFGFGYFKAATSSFIYGCELHDGSPAQQDVFYQAQLIRNFGLAHYQMDSTGRSAERMASSIQWILDKNCPLDREIDPEVLLEEFPELEREEALELIKEEQTYMTTTLRSKLEGFLNGARYDDIPNRNASEWDERSALTAIKHATSSLQGLLMRDAKKCRKKKVRAVMQAKPQKILDYWTSGLWTANFELDQCNNFIEKYNLTWD